MARYIDADEALRISKEGRFMWAYDLTDLEEFLTNVPSVDAVEVVRCKDCAWYRDEERICVNPHCTKSYYGCRVREENFCSFGERRGDDDECRVLANR